MSGVTSKYEPFDRGRLLVKPLAERANDLQLGRWMRLDEAAPEFTHPQLGEVARRIVAIPGDQGRRRRHHPWSIEAPPRISPEQCWNA